MHKSQLPGDIGKQAEITNEENKTYDKDDY